jgi:hypothetical protein
MRQGTGILPVELPTMIRRFIALATVCSAKASLRDLKTGQRKWHNERLHHMWD